jgi:uncharacterized membrane protein (DUF373 family)
MPTARSSTSQAPDRSGPSDDDTPRFTRVGEKVLSVAEDAVYTVVAVLLVAGAVVLLVGAGRQLSTLGEGTDVAALGMLDRLLLVFVLVELLYAVRMTLVRREIVAEPFLIVGIIASIKEIILLSVEVANVVEGKETTGQVTASVEQFALLIGLLGVLVLVLAGAALLLRIKERSPVEGARNAEDDRPDPT